MTTLIDQFLTVAEAYAAAKGGMSDAKLSMALFNDWKRIGLLRAGRDQSTRSHEKRMQLMSDTWPEGVKWPAGISRPPRNRVAPPVSSEQTGAAA